VIWHPNTISQEYFAQVSQIIPLLLVATGLEASLFRRNVDNPVRRAMTILTIAVLCVGEASRFRHCRGQTRTTTS